MTDKIKTAPRELPLGALMVDIGGTELTAAEREFLTQPAIGGVILFARNYANKKQVASLICAIKKLRTPQLLIGVDQEGGRVQRFRDGFYNLPPLNICGAIYDQDRARGLRTANLHAQIMAAELNQVGVDFSFAPVVDCAHPQSEVIGDRALHSDANAVAELAAAYCDGLAAAGMPAVGKHFPGHGGVAADSHYELPTDSRALTEIQARDMIPFARLAKKLGGVMTAHVNFPKVDSRLPTYSKFWLGEILRGQLNFRGVIFSDDLSMRGAGDEKIDIATRCKNALAAGCDIALVCNAAAAARAAADRLGDAYQCDHARAASMRRRPATPHTKLTVAKLSAEFTALQTAQR